jgi:hypothetical protein
MESTHCCSRKRSGGSVACTHLRGQVYGLGSALCLSKLHTHAASPGQHSLQTINNSSVQQHQVDAVYIQVWYCAVGLWLPHWLDALADRGW